MSEIDGQMPYTLWRKGKDKNRVGDPPRLRYTDPNPTSYKGNPWCDACEDQFYRECYCVGCKGADPVKRGKHFGCRCYLNRQMQREVAHG